MRLNALKCYVNDLTNHPITRNQIDETTIGYKAIFKTSKISPQYKKKFKVNFRDIKKFICARFGILIFWPSKLRYFFAPKKCLKKRLKFYIFFL